NLKPSARGSGFKLSIPDFAWHLIPPLLDRVQNLTDVCSPPGLQRQLVQYGSNIRGKTARNKHAQKVVPIGDFWGFSGTSGTAGDAFQTHIGLQVLEQRRRPRREMRRQVFADKPT